MHASSGIVPTFSSSRSVSLTWLLLLILLPSFSVSDVFTSTDKIFTAAMQEANLLDHLQSYINDEYDTLKTMTNFLTKHTKKFHAMSQETLYDMVQHPNGAYTLIKQFITTWGLIIRKNPAFLNKIDHLKSHLPTANDYIGALSALIRLQRVYSLRTEDMYVGNFSGHLGPPLEPMDTYFLGKQAFQDNYIKESIEWLELARNTFLAERETTVDKNKLSEWRTEATALLGKSYLLMNRTKEAKELNAEGPSGQTLGDLGDLGDVQRVRSEQQNLSRDKHEVDFFKNLTELCSRDKNQRVAAVRSFHICRYKPSLYIPYLRFEEEILSIEPFASIFYNVMSDQDGEMITTFMRGKLQRGQIDSGERAIFSPKRTSDVGWISDTDLEVALKMSKRIQAITWLEVVQSNSEPLQMVNYGIGGHYTAHMDSKKINETQPCNRTKFCRLATFLIYLSDVQKGGHTVFLHSGISVAPKKGMALFWYNYQPSMELDRLTMHSGCPVLMGQKWIVNKWIQSPGNMFARPCGPRPNSTQLDIEDLMYSRLRK